MSSLSAMKIKVILGNDIRRWRYAQNSTLCSLNEFVASSFNTSHFWLQYEDEEEDRLTLSSQNDFEDAFACALEEDRKSLKIYVVEGTLPSAQREQQQQADNPSSDHSDERKQSAPTTNNCQAIKAAAIDFLSDKQIIALLPALHRQFFDAIKASKQRYESMSAADNAPNDKWDSPASIEQIIRRILSNNDEFKPIIAHKLYKDKLHAMIPCFATKIALHLPILMSFSTEAIAAWIPHLASVLGHHRTFEQSSMSSFFPLMCAFMSQHGDYSGCMPSHQSDVDSNGEIIHYGVRCDACNISPIKGNRFKCAVCGNFDLCGQCESFHKHDPNHPLIKFSTSARRAVPPFHGLHEMMSGYGHGPHKWFGHHWKGRHHAQSQPQQQQRRQQWWHQQQAQNANGNCGGRGWKKWNRWNSNQQQCGSQNNGQWQAQSSQQQHPWQQWCNGRQPSDNAPVIVSNLCKDKQNKKANKVMAEFCSDITLPDRSYYPTDTVLTKTWKMRNNGDHEWGNNVELVFFKGNESLTLEKRYPVNNAQCGEEIEVSAVIKTPKAAGRYCSYYRLQRNHEYFGPRVWVDIFAVDEHDESLNNNCGQQKNKKFEKKQQKMKAKQGKLEAKIDCVVQKLNAQSDNVKSQKLVAKKEKLDKKLGKLQQKADKKKECVVVIDEQQLLDDIANAAVKDLNLNEEQKQGGSLSCVCGSLLTKTSPIRAYNASAQVNCDICGCFVPSNGEIYHCPNQQSVHHPEGYDLCPNCVDYQFNQSGNVKQPMPIKQEVFRYAGQLEQLRAMGFNNDAQMKKELVEQKGNVQRVANRLLLHPQPKQEVSVKWIKK